MKRALFSIAAVLVLALPASSSAATISVKISATTFNPKTVTVNQGDSVEWVNIDKVNHQLVANNGAFASSILKPAAKFSFTFNAAGTFHYHDALKPSLTGTVVVKGPPPSISLGVNNPIVFYGDQTTISGTVSSAKANESVTILAQPFGSSTQQVATLVTGTGGAFVYTTTPTAFTIYSVKWKTATSQPMSVQVVPSSRSTGDATRLFAKITASHPFEGRSIYLQRRSSFGQWVTVEKLKLGPNSGRIFKAPHKKGTFTYRVYMTTNQAGSGYLDTWSNSVRVRYRH